MKLFKSNLIGTTNMATDSAELFLALVVITIALISLIFWRKAFIQFRQNQELIPYQRSERVLGFIDVVVIFAAWIGSQIAIGIALVMVVGLNAVNQPNAMDASSDVDMLADQGVLTLYLLTATGIGALLLAGAFLVVRYKTANAFGLRFNDLKKQIGYGVVVFVMLFPVVVLIQWLLSMLVKYEHPILSMLAENPSFVSIFGCWAAAVLTAPFLEEFLFRGVFQNWLERLSVSKLSNNQLFVGGPNVADLNSNQTHAIEADNSPDTEMVVAELVTPAQDIAVSDTENINPYQSPQNPAIYPTNDPDRAQQKSAYWPIFASALCFALVHLGQGLAPIPLFILAVGLGYLFRQTGSLIACITVHFLLNFYSMFVFTIMVLLGATP